MKEKLLESFAELTQADSLSAFEIKEWFKINLESACFTFLGLKDLSIPTLCGFATRLELIAGVPSFVMEFSWTKIRPYYDIPDVSELSIYFPGLDFITIHEDTTASALHWHLIVDLIVYPNVALYVLNYTAYEALTEIQSRPDVMMKAKNNLDFLLGHVYPTITLTMLKTANELEVLGYSGDLFIPWIKRYLNPETLQNLELTEELV